MNKTDNQKDPRQTTLYVVKLHGHKAEMIELAVIERKLTYKVLYRYAGVFAYTIKKRTMARQGFATTPEDAIALAVEKAESDVTWRLGALKDATARYESLVKLVEDRDGKG